MRDLWCMARRRRQKSEYSRQETEEKLKSKVTERIRRRGVNRRQQRKLVASRS
jgi:hypothetical protein